MLSLNPCNGTFLLPASLVISLLRLGPVNAHITVQVGAYCVSTEIFAVHRQTRSKRRYGVQSRQDSSVNSRKPSDLEENAILKYVLDLGSRGLPPQNAAVEDMANRLLAERDASYTGSQRFVARHAELKTRLNRKYDYQRAQCEDQSIIRGWFQLVQNTTAKYKVLDQNIYNFDDTGFLMGQISTTTNVKECRVTRKR